MTGVRGQRACGHTVQRVPWRSWRWRGRRSAKSVLPCHLCVLIREAFFVRKLASLSEKRFIEERPEHLLLPRVAELEEEEEESRDKGLQQTGQSAPLTRSHRIAESGNSNSLNPRAVSLRETHHEHI